MSIVPRAWPGTVLAASPPATVVITEVISGRPSASALDAQHLVRQRGHRAAAAGGVRSRMGGAAGHLQRAPDRALAGADHVAVGAAALEHQRRVGIPCLGAHRRRRAAAPPRRRRPAAAARRTLAGRRASVSRACTASTSPPFMSATPGPKQRSPSRRNGRSAAVPSGNTVSVCPSSATTAAAALRAGTAPCCGPGCRARSPSGGRSRRAPATRRCARRPAPARCRGTASRC